MIRLLAIDTSSWWGSIALIESGDDFHPRTIAEAGMEVRGTHSIFLLEWIDELLSRNDWDKRSLDAFVVVQGPGSFTGIRIGLGTVRGLAMATDRPALAVGTMESVACAYGVLPHPRHVLLDAGRGEVYWQAFDGLSDPPLKQGAPLALSPGAAMERVAADGGWAICQSDDGDFITRLGSSAFRVAAPQSLAGAAGRIGAAALAAVDSRHREQLLPVYVRAPDAVVKPRS